MRAGETVAVGVSITDAPGHTKSHISILVDMGEDKILVAGDALPDGGTVKRGLPCNVFSDENDATESVAKMGRCLRRVLPRPRPPDPAGWR